MSKRILRLAFLHLAPLPGDLTHNRRLIETAITTAAEAGATWIITPELAVCGYTFADRIGTDWIVPQPDAWMMSIFRLAARYRVALFLSYPERDRRVNSLYNSLFVIGPDGAIVGTHRKINTLRVGSESWSTPGKQARPVPIVPFDRVGLLICADAFSTRIAESLRAQGARILVSSAAWAPGLHGPNGEWERCTRKTGLPLFVCNRTGPDTTLNFMQAVSVVVKDGRRLLSLSSTRSTVFVINWNLDTQDMATPAYQRIELQDGPLGVHTIGRLVQGRHHRPREFNAISRTLQGLRFGIQASWGFWTVEEERRTKPTLRVVVGPPIPHALVFFPAFHQLDLLPGEGL